MLEVIVRLQLTKAKKLLIVQILYAAFVLQDHRIVQALQVGSKESNCQA